MNDVAGAPLTHTPLTAVNEVPLRVMTVPPCRGPDDGDTAAMTGGSWKVKRPAGTTAEVPPGVVTRTSTSPSACAGRVTWSWVAETRVTAVASSVPKVTAATRSKPSRSR